MNNKISSKPSQQYFRDHNRNKQNQSNNTQKQQFFQKYNKQKKLYSKQQIISLKKIHSKKLQQFQLQKQKQISNIKKLYQQQKMSTIYKYQQVILQKDHYIQMLEQLCAGQQKLNSNTKVIQQQKPNNFKIYKNQTNFSDHSQALYLHQAPLYEQICYTIERPTTVPNQQVSQFCQNQKSRAILASNEKGNYSKCSNSIKSSKLRSSSTTRIKSTSKHILAPVCPPKYSKIL